MEIELWEQVYEAMTCHVSKEYCMPGVEDAFADNAFCMQKYRQMRDAYDRLCERLGVEDEDTDVECIIQCYMEIQRELCKRMFLYGQKTGFTKFS